MYRQENGGSIGDRWTGSAAEIVMQDWSEQYQKILDNSGLVTLLLAGYVDDGRQATTVLPMGSRYDEKANKFISTPEGELEDKKKQAEGESCNQRMARVCLKAMNSINPNLEFTVECQEEFPQERLPTLDFSIWQESNGTLNHVYFQKEMKTPLVIMSRSGMGNQQKIQMLANDLTRRLYNTSTTNIRQEEYNKICNQMTQELKNAEYNHHTAREIITSGIRGWRTRLARRAQKGQEMYRLARTTTKDRHRKKIVGRENWYKNQDTNKEITSTNGWRDSCNTSNRNNKNNTRNKNNKNKENIAADYPVQAVMFVPHTPGSTLAKLLRENEEKIAKLTKNKLKIVERAGKKLQDIITKSNPWRGQDCQRENCLICITKTRTEKGQGQDCTRRSLIYETRCLTCEELEIEKIEKMEIDEEEKISRKNKIQLYKYIGETSRSGFERGWEHLSDFAQLKSTSHMLKHTVGVHEGQDLSTVKFGMRIIHHCKSSFERQIKESVLIQAERQDHHLLNSRSEYNRCSLPRLCTQVGDGEYNKVSKELEIEKKEEEKLEYKIRMLRKERNKARLEPTRIKGPASKRRKTENNEYINVDKIWGQPAITSPKKHKIDEKKAENPPWPARGSPSPGTSPKDRIEEKQVQNPNKKLRKDSPSKNKKNQITLENLRVLENRTFEATETNKDLEMETVEEWDRKIKEYRLEIEMEEKKRLERLEKKEQKENSWALYRVCQEYLEENCEIWAKQKTEREKERLRLERLDKAKKLTRKAKIRELEKKIDAGIMKMTEIDRKKYLEDEKKRKKLEIAESKKALWKLRNHEKKLEVPESLQEVTELKRKIEKIVDILRQEKERIEEEKRKE